ncbi:MAG TPA: alpha/beta hydrolase [Acholeplasmatales bacterium]|nr:alpha/beta hydrolase [Acholeplasmatales bacterium]
MISDVKAGGFLDRALIIIAIVVGSLFLLLVIISFLCFAIGLLRFPQLDLSNERQTKGTAYEGITPLIKASLKWVNEQKPEKVTILSNDKLKLAAKFVAAEEAIGTFILFHGYRSMVKNDFSVVLKAFIDHHYNVLLVDHRAHGDSEGHFITFGVKESEDVALWAKYVSERYPNLPIFLNGLSMGASSALMSTRFELPKEVQGIIADSGPTSPKEIIHHFIKHYTHLSPKPIYTLIRFWAKLLAKVDLSELSAVEILKKNTVPVLFIHGKADTVVPVWMSERNYEACQSYKEIVLVDKAEHGTSFLVNRPKVMATLSTFMENCSKPVVESKPEKPSH